MFLTVTGSSVVVAGLGIGGFSAVDLYQRVERALRHPVPVSGVLTVEESTGSGWSVDRYLVRTFPDGRVTTEVDRSARLPRGLRIQEVPGGELEVRLPGLLGVLPIRVSPGDPRALTRQGFKAADVTPVALARAVLAQADRWQRGVRQGLPEGLVGVHLPAAQGLPPGVDGAEAGVAPDGTVRWGCFFRRGEAVYRFHLETPQVPSGRTG